MFGLIRAELDHQRSKFALWFPILLGVGIAGYFMVPREPNFLELQGAALIGCICLWLSFRLTYPTSFVPIILAIVILGAILASIRAHSVSGAVLGWRYYGSVEGTVIAIDKSASNKTRVTLADPILSKVGPNKTPIRVRVSLHSKVAGVVPEPGMRVMLTAHLSAPNGPTEPGGYDFQRRAWFKKLGAIGYSRTPVMPAKQHIENRPGVWVFSLRMRLSKAIQTRVGGQSGGFAAAILTGDRSAVDPTAVDNLRRANLAHLLAISGLHMGLMTGVVFAFVRYGIALLPFAALRLPSKKIAAVTALAAGFSYLVISGASVATERAFIMVAIMLGAVLLDRPALSLRAVAIAATVILVMRPENLLEPGFQMSFAATSALVIVFGSLSKSAVWRASGQGWIRHARPTLSLIVSSLVAGLATAPISAFHFNQVAHFGLIANTASLPVMGFVVMPSALVGIALTPIGLDWIAWTMMHSGIDWILTVAEWIAGFEGAVSLVPSAPEMTLGVLVFAAAIIVSWRTPLRFLGGVAAVLALVLWMQADRPDILLSHDGRLVGALTEKGRALNRDRGSGFAARSWLENDGDAATQKDAAARLRSEKDKLYLDGASQKVAYLWQRKPNWSEVLEACKIADILIVPKWKEDLPNGCKVLDSTYFQRAGSTAIWFGTAEAKIKTARQVTGTRLWNSKEIRGQ